MKKRSLGECDYLPGWYLTQLSTIIYVPFFATLAGTGITQQAGPTVSASLMLLENVPNISYIQHPEVRGTLHVAPAG